MNCQSCGAPINPNDEVCEYCGTITRYGISISQEQKRRHALENLPKIKYVPMPFVIALCILTLGCYAPYQKTARKPLALAMGMTGLYSLVLL